VLSAWTRILMTARGSERSKRRVCWKRQVLPSGEAARSGARRNIAHPRPLSPLNPPARAFRYRAATRPCWLNLDSRSAITRGPPRAAGTQQQRTFPIFSGLPRLPLCPSPMTASGLCGQARSAASIDGQGHKLRHLRGTARRFPTGTSAVRRRHSETRWRGRCFDLSRIGECAR
jgi:hypothetical protein